MGLLARCVPLHAPLADKCNWQKCVLGLLGETVSLTICREESVEGGRELPSSIRRALCSCCRISRRSMPNAQYPEAGAEGRRWRRRDLLPRVGGRANRPRSRGHSRPKILALLPDFSRSSLRLLGLRPNLYLVQLPRVPRRSWAGALRPPGFTPRRRVLVTSFPGAGQWGAAGADVFLRMGFLPNQFKFSSPPNPRPRPLQSGGAGVPQAKP